MQRERPIHLTDSQRWIVALGVLAASLSIAWRLGAWASPALEPHARLRSQAPGPADALKTAATSPLVPPQTFEVLPADQAVLINAALPASPLPNPAARPFKLTAIDPDDRTRAKTCLTMAIYYEAANQGAEGEAAVAQVVLNRLRNPLFPKTICGVVFEGSTLPTGCQFTFTCDGSLGRPPSQAGWRNASDVAERALNGYVQKAVGDATHYHTIWVVPYWRSSLVKLTQIGAHIFYRWSGGLGQPNAFFGQYAGSESAPPAIKGFDLGLAPTEHAQLNDRVVVPPAAPAPEPTIVAPAKPVQVAMMTTDASPALVAAIKLAPPQRPSGYFGGSAGANQHLPMPAH